MPYDRSAFSTASHLAGVAFDYLWDAQGLVADKLFVPKPVDRDKKKIYQFDGSKLRRYNTIAATNATPQLVDEQLFSHEIELVPHKLAKEVDPSDVARADEPGLVDEGRAVQVVTNGILLDREIIASTLACTSTNYKTTLTSAIASGSRWNEANGDPESDKIAADEALHTACGATANACVMDASTLRKLRTSPALRDRVKYSMAGPIPMELIKAFLDVEFLFVASVRYNTAQEGAAATISSIWSTNVIFFVYNPSLNLQSMSFGLMGIPQQGPMWTAVDPLPLKRGAHGPMSLVQVGHDYGFAPGFVESASSAKFAAGYLYRTAVA